MSSAKKSPAKGAKKSTAANKESPAADVVGPRGSNAALEGPVVGDASVVRGFSFTDELDRLFAAGFPHCILLSPEPVAEDGYGSALVEVLSKAPYSIEWPANLARPLVRLLPVRGIGALVPGTTTLTDQGREVFANTSDVSEDELETLIRGTLGASFFYPTELRSALWLFEAAVGARALVALARAMQSLTKERLYRMPDLASVLYEVPTMLLRTTVETRDEALGLFREIYEKQVERPHVHTLSELRAIDVLDVVVHGAEALRRRYPNGVGHGDLGYFSVPASEALDSYRAAAGSSRFAYNPDVRRVFVAGKEALDFEARWLARYGLGGDRTPKAILETFGLVNDARTVGLLLRLRSKRSLVKPVDAWMRRHSALARPELERLAGGTELAALAGECLASTA